MSLAGNTMTGDDVKEVQNVLNRNGFFLKTDGIYGGQTSSAVKKYQKENALEVDGVVNAKTEEALKRTTTITIKAKGNKGKLFVDGQPFGRTLEADNSLKEGEHEAKIIRKEMSYWGYDIIEVNGYYILIGNLPKDTKDAILVGEKFQDKALVNSRETFEALMDEVKGKLITVKKETL